MLEFVSWRVWHIFWLQMFVTKTSAREFGDMDENARLAASRGVVGKVWRNAHTPPPAAHPELEALHSTEHSATQLAKGM